MHFSIPIVTAPPVSLPTLFENSPLLQAATERVVFSKDMVLRNKAINAVLDISCPNRSGVLKCVEAQK